MIEGFKLKVSSEELKKHCMDRSEYHSRRASEKQATLPDLQRSLDTLKSGKRADPTNAGWRGTSQYRLDPDDPIKELQQDIAEHHNKSLIFQFYSQHLFDDDYCLERQDLDRLEIVSELDEWYS